MKKIFSFFAAALLSASMFASREAVPTDADLAAYATGTYTMCIYNDGACNDIVLNGTYIGWPNDGEGCLVFQAVTGFDGWYVVTWEDATDPAAAGGVQAKPIQLDGSGTFNWDYQLGPDAELIRGNATLVSANNGTEVDIKEIQPGIVVIDVKSWKNNPCTAVYHNYVVTLVSPDCNDEDFITPAISGGFNGWAQEAMTMDELATAERQNAGLLGAVYRISFRAAEGAEYKFRSSEEWGADWSNELKAYDAAEDAWVAFNGGSNLVLGTETNPVFDLGDPELYSWTNCEKPEPIECDPMDYIITVTFPACEAATPAIVGSFAASNWNTFIPMEATATPNVYTVTVNALCTEVYKFADVVLEWQNEIVNVETGKGLENIPFGEEATITLDYSADYEWKACQEPTALENVAVKAAAVKAIENGRLVIKMGEKKFTVLGAEL